MVSSLPLLHNFDCFSSEPGTLLCLSTFAACSNSSLVGGSTASLFVILTSLVILVFSSWSLSGCIGLRSCLKYSVLLDLTLFIPQNYPILIFTDVLWAWNHFSIILISLYVRVSWLNSSPFLIIVSVIWVLFFLQQGLCTCLFYESSSCFLRLVGRARNEG